ncbi:hypothetical protein KIW84_020838 [Lathyrus oleraceus]|uniref:PGG domain-containing protein n=1 Tax=Pisum sativum TaxID=3888 RepID=A0A9D4YAQ2_PEA|nr:hypothetical protein KIW84_020838 [Pisum sativum]
MELNHGLLLSFLVNNPYEDEAVLLKIIKEMELEIEHISYFMALVNPNQDEARLKELNARGKDPELEIEPSEIESMETCDDEIDMETPMENSELHIAAWNGDDETVTRLIEDDLDRLLKGNKNKDTALHVAARAGNFSTLEKLLKSYSNYIMQFYEKYLVNKYEKESMGDLFVFLKRQNKHGNSVFHEAMLCEKSSDMIFKICEDLIWRKYYYDYAINIVNHANKTALYLAVENGNKDAVKLILDKCCKDDHLIKGLSPLVAAISMHNPEMLRIILKHKPTWIHSMDKHQRLPLHYAAFIGSLECVDLLLGLCNCCTIQRDKYGYFPIHLASYGGHVEVVKNLLQYYPDPTEMLDSSYERNILHIAAKHGKHEVICYILQSEIPEHHKLINQKDNKGETPLHLAARSCHPSTVYYLVNDKNKRVNLDLVNKNNETTLDIVNALYEHLTWIALKSAGAKESPKKLRLHTESKQSDSNSQKTEQVREKNLSYVEEYQQCDKQSKKEENVSERYKDRLENLTIVSTLIVTASVAGCFAVPGEADGKANNLNHAMFQFFIIFITISFFSSISATIILFWASLGVTELVSLTLKNVMPLLGVALISLSLAFMTGLYTVISELYWLANVFLVMSVIFIIIGIFLYILLFLPSSSTIKPLRYISKYPFLYLASRSECKMDKGLKP